MVYDSSIVWQCCHTLMRADLQGAGVQISLILNRMAKMKYGYTIVYVSSVAETLEFYKRAFGLDVKLILESGDYGELATGETILAFASHKLGDANLGGRYISANPQENPLGMELSFIAEDVEAAYKIAVAAGAVPVKEPEQKPWGQVVAYVRAIEGSIIELGSPIGG